MNAFQTARLQLTAWYLLIIMALSVTFSVVIYQALTHEVERFERSQRFFIERRLEEGELIPPDRLHRFQERIPINPELIGETKQRILFMIIAANAGILVASGGLGFFLATRTLKPIKKMVDEQNRFITDASHELKTPLTSLRTELEVATLDEKMTQKQTKQLVKSSLEEVIGLQSLAENLIELTQQQKRIGHLRVEDVSLLDIIESALKKVVPLAKQKHITIDNEVDDYILKGEYQSLSQLFIILLDNAVKYSPKKTEVRLTSNKTDHMIEVVVSDNGMGVDEDDLPYIFDRFYRADKSRSRIAGYGLGLSIAKQIVETHKGSLSVQSEPNTGTAFRVHLPIAPAKT